MKKPLLTIIASQLLLSVICRAYESHDVYQMGDQYLVDFNLVLADLSLAKATLFFPTEEDLKEWLIEQDGSKTRINRTPGRIKSELVWEIIPGPKDVVINDHNRFPPYYVAYLLTDDAGQTWKYECEWTDPLSAGLLIESILNDPAKKLVEMPPLEVTGIDYQITAGKDRVVFIEP